MRARREVRVTPAPMIGLLEAVEDPRLIGLALYPKQRELMEGFERTPSAVVAAGRRGGKTTCASAVMIYDCVCRPDLDERVKRGEVRFAVAVATNLDQSRKLIETARLIVESSPVLSAMLKHSTADELLFEMPSGARSAIRSFPCSSRGARGYPISTLCMDEAHHFVTSEDGDQTADRVFNALRPATLQFGSLARVLLISSPLGTTGLFADYWKRARSGALPGWAAYQYTSKELNPSLSDEFLAALEEESPETFPSEYLAEFESGGSLWLDRSRVRVDEDLHEAGPEDADSFVGALDASYAGDSFGVALLGRKGENLVLGPVRAIAPDRAVRKSKTWEVKRDAQDRVTEEVVRLCREYGARTYVDQHESAAVIARARELGLAVSVYAMDRDRKHKAFVALRTMLYSGQLVLPDHPTLLDEMMRVKVKIEQAGAKIILPRSSSGHCDQIQALALAAVHARHASGSMAAPRAGRSMWSELNDALPEAQPTRDRFGQPKRALRMADLEF
jgi:hypothetical protein